MDGQEYSTPSLHKMTNSPNEVILTLAGTYGCQQIHLKLKTMAEMQLKLCEEEDAILELLFP